jgi:hypothetical protein
MLLTTNCHQSYVVNAPHVGAEPKPMDTHDTQDTMVGTDAARRRLRQEAAFNKAKDLAAATKAKLDAEAAQREKLAAEEAHLQGRKDEEMAEYNEDLNLLQVEAEVLRKQVHKLSSAMYVGWNY